jgi:hypothetical protein
VNETRTSWRDISLIVLLSFTALALGRMLQHETASLAERLRAHATLAASLRGIAGFGPQGQRLDISEAATRLLIVGDASQLQRWSVPLTQVPAGTQIIMVCKDTPSHCQNVASGSAVAVVLTSDWKSMQALGAIGDAAPVVVTSRSDSYETHKIPMALQQADGRELQQWLAHLIKPE